MAEAKFILKEPKGNSDTLIYLFYNFDYKRLKYSTGEKINPKYWNPKKQRAKETKEFKEYPELNTRLDNIEAAVKSSYRKLKNDKQPLTSLNLKSELEIALEITKPTNKVDFISFIGNYIEEMKSHKRPATITAYNTILKTLKQFSTEKRTPINFENITLDFYSAFTKYLSEEKGYLNNTTGKYFRIIKVFLNEATERGINSQLDFRSKKFKALKEDTDQIYLNEDELRQFYKLDLSENIRLEKIRDLFLIGCYTGLRFSDFSNLNESNIDFDRNTIKVKTQKTGQLVTIPLRPVVLDIFKKYNNSIPPAISNQKMNLYLKELGKKAEMFSLISISKAAGKNVSKNIYKKFELITTHTARRSFASNAYLAGVPTISIMKLTGHKTEKAFMQYIRITQEENALMMLEHSHFKS